MVPLLKVKKRIYQFVGRFEIYVVAAVKFLIAFTAFYMINTYLHYNDLLDGYPVSLILALLCCFLPSGLMMFFAAVLVLVQLYGLSVEMCGIMALIFVILFCVYFRFSTRKGLYCVLTSLCGIWGIPYVMPVSAGLFSQPYTSVSVVCGVAVSFILKNVRDNSALFSEAAKEASTKSIVTMAATQIFRDEEMYLYIVAFVVATIVVYCVKKLSADHARLIASVVGIVIQLVLICCGEIYFGNGDQIIPVTIGCVVSLLIVLVADFMTMGLDYSRVERLQFEDDEYYYYVKAVPKAEVAAAEKTVKTINEKQTHSHKKNTKNRRK